jgi:ribosomal-protein-alanine N-acetyltransferase
MLRRFREEDLETLFALDQLCFRAGISYSKNELAFYAHHPAVLTLVAEDDRRIAGFAMADVARARRELSGHVITIDVHPESRRSGVGRLLMAGIEDWLREREIPVCSLEVAIDDPGALNFYQKLSYELVGKIRGYYMGTLDAYVLRKTLVA